MRPKLRLSLKVPKSVRLVLKAHKYLKKYKSPSGKWVYVYPQEKVGRKETLQEKYERYKRMNEVFADLSEGMPGGYASMVDYKKRVFLYWLETHGGVKKYGTGGTSLTLSEKGDVLRKKHINKLAAVLQALAEEEEEKELGAPKPKSVSASMKYKELPRTEWAVDYHVAVTKDNEGVALEIPEKYLHGVFTMHGLTFVVHNTIGTKAVQPDSFTVTEVTTGLKIAVLQGSDPKKAQEAGREKLWQYTTAQMQDLVKTPKKINSKPAIEFQGVMKDPSGYFLDDKSRKIIGMMTGSDIGSEDEIKKWAESHDIYLGSYSEGFVDSNVDTLIFAITRDMSFDKAQNYQEILNELVSGGFSYAEVMVWVNENKVPLEDYNWDDDGYLLAHALNNDMSVDQAQEDVNEDDPEDVEERRYDIEEGEIAGKTWYDTTYRAAKKWLYGESIKYIRMAVSINDGTAKEDDWVSDDFQDIAAELEDHMWHLSEQYTMYRGTNNDVWKLAKPGDVIPIGMASFSKDESRGRGFATRGGTVLVLESPRGVRGIDFHGILEGDYSDEVYRALDQLGSTAYSHEEEVLVRAPQVRVKKVIPPDSEESVSAERETEKTRVILEYIEPKDLTKALEEMTDEERVKAMADDFNKPLHRKSNWQERARKRRGK